MEHGVAEDFACVMVSAVCEEIGLTGPIWHPVLSCCGGTLDRIWSTLCPHTSVPRIHLSQVSKNVLDPARVGAATIAMYIVYVVKAVTHVASMQTSLVLRALTGDL